MTRRHADGATPGAVGNRVVPLGIEPEPEPPPRPLRGLHGVAVTGMAASALIGCLATMAFVGVAWPGATGRFVTGLVVVSAVSFLICASAAVFAAARNTYATPSAPHEEPDPHR